MLLKVFIVESNEKLRLVRNVTTQTPILWMKHFRNLNLVEHDHRQPGIRPCKQYLYYGNP